MTTDSRTRTPREQLAADAARELLLVADGYEDAGHPNLAWRSRNVARELLWALGCLGDERAARVAMQAARDDAVGLLCGRVDFVGFHPVEEPSPPDIGGLPPVVAA